MKRKLRLITALATLVAFIGSILLLVGCAKEEPDVYKIGAVLPLTGGLAFVGEDAKNGIELAETYVNSEGGIRGKEIQFVYGDSKNDPKEGITVVNEFISVRKLPVIITAMSSVSNAVLPVADTNGIALAATIVSASEFAKTSEWAFRYFLTSGHETEAMADFALSKLGIKNAAVLYVNDDYGLDAKDVFEKYFVEKGGKTVFTDGYGKQESDFRTLIVKTNATHPEAIYIVGYGNTLAIMAKQIRESGYKGYIFSFSSFGAANVIAQAGDAAEGVYLTTTSFEPTAPSTEKSQRFVADYEKRFGKKPTHYAAFAHDLAIILCEAMRKSKDYTSRAVKESLADMRTFEGLFGIAHLSVAGEYEFNVLVKQIKNGKVVSPGE